MAKKQFLLFVLFAVLSVVYCHAGVVHTRVIGWLE